MPKKMLCILLAVFLFLPLFSSCKRTNDTADYTVENVPLTAGEQEIADATSDIVKRFKFAKGKRYDVKIYLYANGSGDTIGGTYGIEPTDENNTVLIGGRKEGESARYSWSLSDLSLVKYSAAELPAVEQYDGTEGCTVKEIGKEKFDMEEGKEYALVYVVYKEGDRFEGASTDVFYEWDTITDKAEALSYFDYAYVVTVQFSDPAEYVATVE